MICTCLLIDNKLVDYRLSQEIKSIGDFNKSLIRAGYPFWLTEGVKVVFTNCATETEAKSYLSSFPLSGKRCFNSVKDEFSSYNKTSCCNCGYYMRAYYNYCPICGDGSNERI